MLKKIILLFLLAFSIIHYFVQPKGMNQNNIVLLLLLAFFALLIFIFSKEKNTNLKGQYLKHSTVIIFGFSIVHFQFHIDYLLGNIPQSFLRIWVNPDIVIQALAVSVSGFIAFLIGYFSYNKIKSRYNKAKNENIIDTKFLVYTSALLLAAYFYFANPLYLLGYYGAERLGVEAQYIILLFKVLIFAILIQNARNFYLKGKSFSNFLDYCKSNGLFFNIIISIYLISVLISGDRGPLMYFSIAYFGNYLFVTKNKLNILKTLGLLILGAFFIMVLGKVRSLDRSLSFSDRFTESLNFESRFETKSFLPQTQELASSVRTLHHTLNHVPVNHDYLYGRFQFQQFMSMIPFGNNFVKLLFEDNSYKYGGSSRFITWINQGDNPYSGDGSSVTADFYFDFGLLGVIFGMFFFGYTMRYAELSMYSLNMPSYFAHSFFIGYLSSAIYISRSTYLIEMKSVFWIFLVLIINQRFINRK